MVEERVRVITREARGVLRSGSESSITEATPKTPIGEREEAFVSRPALGGGDAFNLFNMNTPEALPDELRAATNLLSGVFEQLFGQFGFQRESVSSQHEHLSMLLANSCARERQSARGLDKLHAKLLDNYKAWARQLGTTPQCAGSSNVTVHKATDLVLYVLIWGEAANLRHVPESLCFLFHQMRAEVWKSPPGKVVSSTRPQGWFLSRVVAPLYRHMRTEMTKKSAKGKPYGHTVK